MDWLWTSELKELSNSEFLFLFLPFLYLGLCSGEAPSLEMLMAPEPKETKESLPSAANRWGTVCLSKEKHLDHT